MNVVWEILWFIVAVGLLVTVHEFGHYWVARRFGFKVLRFSVGFGRPLFKRIAGKDKTEYVIAALPIGGYVKMLDEREGPVEPHELPRSFTRKPPWQRILVLLAGPGFNVLFAVLVLWGMFWVNGVNEIKPLVGEVTMGSPAARAGLKAGDEVISINGGGVRGQTDVTFALLDAVSSNGEAALTVRSSDGVARTVTLDVPSAVERRKLTEPQELFKGLGFEFWEPFVLPAIAEVKPGGPADKAGLKKGDIILSVNGKTLSFRELVPLVSANAGESLLIRYRRGTTEGNLRVTPVRETEAGKPVGRIQVSVTAQPGIKYPQSMRLHIDLNPGEALAQASREAWSMTAIQARLVWRMVLGHVSFKNLSGPISIAEIAGQSAQGGVASFLGFLVLISLSLGFLNLLPVPILDGGQIVFQAVEWLKGKPLSERAQVLGQQIGIALLVLLMGVALFNDIARHFN